VDLGIPRPEKSAKVVLVRPGTCYSAPNICLSEAKGRAAEADRFSTGRVVSVMIPHLGAGQREVFCGKTGNFIDSHFAWISFVTSKICLTERVSRVAATAAIAVFDFIDLLLPEGIFLFTSPVGAAYSCQPMRACIFWIYSECFRQRPPGDCRAALPFIAT